jgi:hypothetical protein
MFIFRGYAVSLAMFALLYSALSTMVVVGWPLFRFWHLGESARARLLFAVRIFPMAASAAVTLGFIVPSFQVLEPRSANESMGAMSLGLGVCGIVLVGLGCYGVVFAQRKTVRIVTGWFARTSLRSIGVGPRVLAFRPLRGVPPVMLVGVRKPFVFVSESAIALLSSRELNVSLKHEFSHLHSHDNLKKLFFRFCPFPGMGKLEDGWNEAAEFAADHAAVTDQASALDLASAMLKLARLIPVESRFEADAICVTGFVSGSVTQRVERLVSWPENEASTGRMTAGSYILAISTCVLFSMTALKYSALLMAAHEVTEWLVR